MKLYKVVFTLFLVGLFSCDKNLQKKIIGQWTLVPQSRPEHIIEQLGFKDNRKVEVITGDLFTSTFLYSLKDDEVFIQTSDTIVNTIKYLCLLRVQ